MGRIRLEPGPTGRRLALVKFGQRVVEPGSAIRTDGQGSYAGQSSWSRPRSVTARIKNTSTVAKPSPERCQDDEQGTMHHDTEKS